MTATAAPVKAQYGQPPAQYEQPAAAAPADEGFGERDSVAFTLERFLGFQSQEIGDDDDSPTIDSTGMQPLYWGNVGVFAMMSSGLNVGSTFGLTYLEGGLFDDDDDGVLFFRAGPRIGYAGSTHRQEFGYWVRGGPSFLFTQSNEESTTLLAASIELYGVIMPVPHFGILVGPHADIHLVGDEDAKYSSLGLTFGVIGEFY